MKKLRTGLLAITLLVGLLAGCGQSQPASSAAQTGGGAAAPTAAPSAPQTAADKFVFPIENDIPTLSYLIEGLKDEGERMLAGVYDPLYSIQKDGAAMYLAESYEVSDDMTQITVTLRDDITWHDGVPITADDLMFNIAFLSDPACTLTMSAVVKLDGEAVQAEKLDERTVRIILPRPSDFFTGRLGKLRMSPAHLYENVAMEDVETSEQNGLGVGSGPYMVSEHKAGEYLGLARYDGYYGEAGPFAEVEYRVIAAASSQEIAFANGEINAFRIQDESGLDQYEGDAGYNVYAMPEGRVNYIQVNGNSAVLTDIAKREAVVKALNMDELVLGAYGSDALALPARSMFHDGDLYYDPAFTGYRQDLEKARQMAADNGLDDAVVKILYNTARAGMEETATMIHQQLVEAGVNAELMGLDSAGFFQALFYPDAGSWDLGLNGYASNGNPSYSISWNTTNGSLASNSAMSEAVDALWVAADEEPDAARRQEKYNELNQAVLDCYSFVPVSCPNLVVATQSEFTGLDAFLARYYNKIV